VKGGKIMDSIVAKNAKRIIWEKGYKQKAIAERAGYSVNVFNAMLNNRRSIIDKDVVRIAQALNVTPNELFLLH